MQRVHQPVDCAQAIAQAAIGRIAIGHCPFYIGDAWPAIERLDLKAGAPAGSQLRQGQPAAMGVLLMQMGKISAKGVLPPEGCINPNDLLELVPKVMKLDSKKEGGESFGGVIVQQIDENGKITNIDI